MNTYYQFSSSDDTTTASASTSAIVENVIDDNESLPMIGIGSYLLCSICPDGVALSNSDQMKEHLINEHTDDGMIRKCDSFDLYLQIIVNVLHVQTSSKTMPI